jgi:hypothetical protein
MCDCYMKCLECSIMRNLVEHEGKWVWMREIEASSLFPLL